MNQVYLGLGSNIGDKKSHLEKAIFLIDKEIGSLIQQSSIYRTKAWGETDQDDFYNQVIEIETKMQVEDVLRLALSIEKKMGRIRKKKWTERIIDIDILFYSDKIENTPTLSIPHPYLHERNFVLIPLLEITKNHIHPKLHMTIEELYDECSDISGIELLEN